MSKNNFEYGAFVLGILTFATFVLLSTTSFATIVSAGNGTHLSCISNTCSLVNGSGNDTCSPLGSSCGSSNQTHLACVNQACVSIAGAGQNLCTSSSECQSNSSNQTHLACVNLACTTVNGAGNSTCAVNSDCAHLGCVYLNNSNQGTCQLVAGKGENECGLGEFCVKKVGQGSQINETNHSVQAKSLKKSPTITGHATCTGISGFFRRIFSPGSC